MTLQSSSKSAGQGQIQAGFLPTVLRQSCFFRKSQSLLLGASADWVREIWLTQILLISMLIISKNTFTAVTAVWPGNWHYSLANLTYKITITIYEVTYQNYLGWKFSFFSDLAYCKLWDLEINIGIFKRLKPTVLIFHVNKRSYFATLSINNLFKKVWPTK